MIISQKQLFKLYIYISMYMYIYVNIMSINKYKDIFSLLINSPSDNL